MFFMQNCVGYRVIKAIFIFVKPAALIFLVVLFPKAKMQICDFRMICNFCFYLFTCNTMGQLEIVYLGISNSGIIIVGDSLYQPLELIW